MCLAVICRILNIWEDKARYIQALAAGVCYQAEGKICTAADRVLILAR